jgi:hypothetical protein
VQEQRKGEPLKVETDGPTLNLAPVQFRNWAEPGIAIAGDKAAQHADNLRLIADGMVAADKHYADYLRGFANQLSPKGNKTKELTQDQPEQQSEPPEAA